MAATGLVTAPGLGVLPFATRADAGAVDLAHTPLPAQDGWASSGSGTTGGQAAHAAHNVTVTTRAELIKALRAGPSGAPRIIRVKGRINAQHRRPRPPVDVRRLRQGTPSATEPKLWACARTS